MPYQITYHFRGSSTIETATAETAVETLRLVDEMERLNDIVDGIISPDGRLIRAYELMSAAQMEKNADRT